MVNTKQLVVFALPKCEYLTGKVIDGVEIVRSTSDVLVNDGRPNVACSCRAFSESLKVCNANTPAQCEERTSILTTWPEASLGWCPHSDLATTHALGQTEQRHMYVCPGDQQLPTTSVLGQMIVSSIENASGRSTIELYPSSTRHTTAVYICCKTFQGSDRSGHLPDVVRLRLTMRSRTDSVVGTCSEARCSIKSQTLQLEEIDEDDHDGESPLFRLASEQIACKHLKELFHKIQTGSAPFTLEIIRTREPANGTASDATSDDTATGPAFDVLNRLYMEHCITFAHEKEPEFRPAIEDVHAIATAGSSAPAIVSERCREQFMRELQWVAAADKRRKQHEGLEAPFSDDRGFVLGAPPCVSARDTCRECGKTFSTDDDKAGPNIVFYSVLAPFKRATVVRVCAHCNWEAHYVGETECAYRMTETSVFSDSILLEFTENVFRSAHGQTFGDHARLMQQKYAKLPTYSGALPTRSRFCTKNALINAFFCWWSALKVNFNTPCPSHGYSCPGLVVDGTCIGPSDSAFRGYIPLSELYGANTDSPGILRSSLRLDRCVIPNVPDASQALAKQTEAVRGALRCVGNHATTCVSGACKSTCDKAKLADAVKLLRIKCVTSVPTTDVQTPVMPASQQQPRILPASLIPLVTLVLDDLHNLQTARLISYGRILRLLGDICGVTNHVGIEDQPLLAKLLDEVPTSDTDIAGWKDACSNISDVFRRRNSIDLVDVITMEFHLHQRLLPSTLKVLAFISQRSYDVIQLFGSPVVPDDCTLSDSVPYDPRRVAAFYYFNERGHRIRDQHKFVASTPKRSDAQMDEDVNEQDVDDLDAVVLDGRECDSRDYDSDIPVDAQCQKLQFRSSPGTHSQLFTAFCSETDSFRGGHFIHGKKEVTVCLT